MDNPAPEPEDVEDDECGATAPPPDPKGAIGGADSEGLEGLNTLT